MLRSEWDDCPHFSTEQSTLESLELSAYSLPCENFFLLEITCSFQKCIPLAVMMVLGECSKMELCWKSESLPAMLKGIVGDRRCHLVSLIAKDCTGWLLPLYPGTSATGCPWCRYRPAWRPGWGGEDHGDRAAPAHGADPADHDHHQSVPVQHRQCPRAERPDHQPGTAMPRLSAQSLLLRVKRWHALNKKS